MSLLSIKRLMTAQIMVWLVSHNRSQSSRSRTGEQAQTGAKEVWVSISSVLREWVAEGRYRRSSTRSLLACMGASLVVEGSTNAMTFQSYLEDVLLPTLKRGQIVVMDNLSAHEGEGQGADRGQGMPADLPATLFA